MKLKKIFKEAARQVRKNGVNAFITICDDEATVEFTLSDNLYDEDGMINDISVDLNVLQDILDNHDGQEDEQDCHCADKDKDTSEDLSYEEFQKITKQTMMAILDKLERGIDEANKKLRES